MVRDQIEMDNTDKGINDTFYKPYAKWLFGTLPDFGTSFIMKSSWKSAV